MLPDVEVEEIFAKFTQLTKSQVSAIPTKPPISVLLVEIEILFSQFSKDTFVAFPAKPPTFVAELVIVPESFKFFIEDLSSRHRMLLITPNNP